VLTAGLKPAKWHCSDGYKSRPKHQNLPIIMKRKLSWLAAFASLLAVPVSNQAVVIDFVGGTAYLIGGGTFIPTDTGGYVEGVDYYVEDGIVIDFIGGGGIIGDYYSIGAGGPVNNSVIHAHWDATVGTGLTSVKFSKENGDTLDLNYVDLTSNTVVGGGQNDGTERSFITPEGGAGLLLPSSDWGFDPDFFGTPGDDIERLYLDSSFDGILSFSVTSENAYCFGLDNFFIDEAAPPPPPVPDAGSAALLLGLGATALAGLKRRLS